MSDTRELTFKEIEVQEDEYREISPRVRLYYVTRSYEDGDEGVGFDFVALECTGYPCDGKNEYEFSPESSVEILVKGIAYFDGIRHLYFGDEKSGNFGYHYYPRLEDEIKILQELRKLEIKYCRDAA